MTKKRIEDFKEEIVRTVQENPVTIIQGETGCGKSTKIPLFLHEAGFKVIITEPRILVTMALAKKIAKKFGPDSLGIDVGYHTGIISDFSCKSEIIFLTEGTELLRILSNKETVENTVLILDELHEWTKEVEILFGLVYKQILNGSSLKLVLMSATLEAKELSVFLGNAPIIDLPTRSYSINSENLPANALNECIIRLVEYNYKAILVFLPCKAEIYAKETELQQLLKNYDLQAEILPLHADLPYEEQQKIFNYYPHAKIILSTDIAQTGMTIPDVCVVDTGLIKEMVWINGVSCLDLRNASKADLIQRKGRTGRCGPGTYYLCSDYDYEKRREYSTPEIQCSDIGSILLTLLKFNIDIYSLPLFHDPTKENINNSLAVLEKIGAIDNYFTITNIGEEMCKLPLDPRAARIMVESKKYGEEVQYDILMCCMIIEFGGILKDDLSKIKNPFHSDLIFQASILKKLLAGEHLPYKIEIAPISINE